jgi:hypothetical protein
MPFYRALISETVRHEVLATVEADNEEEALEKLENGETVAEERYRKGLKDDVTDRHLMNRIESVEAPTPKPKEHYDIAVGNPFDGMTVYGPFEESTHASQWALMNAPHDQWSIVPVESPEDGEHEQESNDDL